MQRTSHVLPCLKYFLLSLKHEVDIITPPRLKNAKPGAFKCLPIKGKQDLNPDQSTCKSWTRSENLSTLEEVSFVAAGVETVPDL